MVMINHSAKEVIAKIVYYGPGLSGKTTNLQYVYDHLDESRRGRMVSSSTEGDRTLFFDLLPIEMGNIQGFETKFQLYTVPGQVRYNRIRKVVLTGADAVVFIADSQKEQLKENKDSLENLRANLKEQGFDLAEMPWVIQYNKRDLPNILPVEILQKELNPTNVPFLEACAKDGTNVLPTLKKISRMLIKQFNEKGFEGAGAARRRISKKQSDESLMPPIIEDDDVQPIQMASPTEIEQTYDASFSDDGEIDVGISSPFFDSSPTSESAPPAPEPEPEPESEEEEDEFDDSLHLKTSQPNYGKKVDVSSSLNAATEEIIQIIQNYGLTMDEIWYVISKINNMYIDMRIRRHLERAKMILDSEGGQIFVLRSEDEFE